MKSPPDVQSEVVKKYKSGDWTHQALAYEHFIGLTTVARILHAAGLKLRAACLLNTGIEIGGWHW